LLKSLTSPKIKTGWILLLKRYGRASELLSKMMRKYFAPKVRFWLICAIFSHFYLSVLSIPYMNFVRDYPVPSRLRGSDFPRIFFLGLPFISQTSQTNKYRLWIRFLIRKFALQAANNFFVAQSKEGIDLFFNTYGGHCSVIRCQHFSFC